ncbi:hypothetical protein SLS60_000126 [Paraconiothyrium brasiliense]|uniref:Uncharacterized protein n=1 Tax=Paraconiothyrium brasiliense TaxID=300254 RepID=A0ABR3S5C9_9PLEO
MAEFHNFIFTVIGRQLTSSRSIVVCQFFDLHSSIMGDHNTLVCLIRLRAYIAKLAR